MSLKEPIVEWACVYCRGIRLVGWSGAGPILCPTCCKDADAFTVITQAWREQRARVVKLETEAADVVTELRALVTEAHAAYERTAHKFDAGLSTGYHEAAKLVAEKLGVK